MLPTSSDAERSDWLLTSNATSLQLLLSVSSLLTIVSARIVPVPEFHNGLVCGGVVCVGQCQMPLRNPGSGCLFVCLYLALFKLAVAN